MARWGETVIAITDLVEVCDEQYALYLGWFALLGQRVRDEPDPNLQRLFATAAQRHAWHAELWANRRPAIPHDAIHELPPPVSPLIEDDLAAAYREHLVAERAELERLRAGVDRDLDPSTVRVIDLVDADLADLQSQAPPPT